VLRSFDCFRVFYMSSYVLLTAPCYLTPLLPLIPGSPSVHVGNDRPDLSYEAGMIYTRHVTIPPRERQRDCAIRIINVWCGFVLTTTLSIMFLCVPNLTRSFTTKTVKGFIGAVGNTPLVCPHPYCRTSRD
jgi:hypothetical protein